MSETEQYKIVQLEESSSEVNFKLVIPEGVPPETVKQLKYSFDKMKNGESCYMILPSDEGYRIVSE